MMDSDARFREQVAVIELLRLITSSVEWTEDQIMQAISEQLVEPVTSGREQGQFLEK